MKLSTILEAGFINYDRLPDSDQEEDTAQLDQPQQEYDPSVPRNDDGDMEQPDQAGAEPTEDQDRQGDIRTIPSAHLVYKRKNENSLYDELWIYKQNQHDTWTMKTYDAIIAGSDIPKGSSTSEDGAQSVERWEVGDPKDTLVFVKISGLSN